MPRLSSYFEKTTRSLVAYQRWLSAYRSHALSAGKWAPLVASVGFFAFTELFFTPELIAPEQSEVALRQYSVWLNKLLNETTHGLQSLFWVAFFEEKQETSIALKAFYETLITPEALLGHLDEKDIAKHFEQSGLGKWSQHALGRETLIRLVKLQSDKNKAYFDSQLNSLSSYVDRLEETYSTDNGRLSPAEIQTFPKRL